jgi:predicted translin family RNA/ssDNA-binding protein
MDEIELTRLTKELMRLLQSVSLSESEMEEAGIDERFEAIKRELDSWFLDGYSLYQAS